MSTSQLTRSFSDCTYPMTDEERLDKSFTMDSEKINELEKENDLLTKKAHKRLTRKNRNTNEPKGFINKVFRWHRKRKLGKIKLLLNSLFPKLTESENVASKWLREVSDKKEIVWQNGNVMLHDMESQIDVYQTHLDFVDDVINDIKQLDYDVFKEINDIKAAFAFSQEIVEKQSKPATSHSKINLVSLDTNISKSPNLSETVKSNSANSSPMSSAVQNCCQDTEIKRPSLPIAAVLKSNNSNNNTSEVVNHTPATWQGVKASKPMHYAKSAFTKSLGESGSNTSTEDTKEYSATDDVCTDSATESCSSDSSSSSSNTNAAAGCCASTAIAFLNPCSAACVWDGADYKRRSLQTMSVSLATLQPQSNTPSPSNKGSNTNANNNSSSNLITRLFNSSSSPTNRHHRSNSTSSNISYSSYIGLSPTSAKRSISTDSSPIISTPSKLGFLSRSSSSRSQSSHHSCLHESDSEDIDQCNTNHRYSNTTHNAPAHSMTNKLTSLRSNARSISSANATNASKPRCLSTPHSININIAISDNSSIISNNTIEMEKIRSYSSASSSASSEESNSSNSSDRHPASNTTTNQPTASTSSKQKKQTPTESKSLTVLALLKQIDSKEYSTEQQLVDEDQVEMLRRIEKCLLVKESLKSILMTMELTREKEMTTLRGVKRLKNNLKEVIALHDAQMDQNRPANQSCAPQLDLPPFLLQSNTTNTAAIASTCDQQPQQQDNNTGDNVMVFLDNQTSYSYDPSTPGCSNHISNSSSSGSSVNSSSNTSQQQQPSSFFKSSCEDSFMNCSSTSSTPFLVDKRGQQPDLLHYCWSEASECVENLSKLVTEENEARDAVAKLTSLINNVQIISKELAEEMDLVNEDMKPLKLPVTPSGGLTASSDMN